MNGRFLSQDISGVQRYAWELLVAMDKLVEGGFIDANRYRFTILYPPNARALPNLREIALRSTGRFAGHFWEQAELPAYSRSGLLLNLCNTAPIVKRAQVVTIHDAAVRAMPQAYTLAFRTWYRLIYFLAGQGATRIITVSQFSKREIIDRLGLPEERIAVVAEGSDHILRAESDESVLERYELRRRPFILAVSSLSPHKNFNSIVRAMEIARLKDVDFVVAGGANPQVFATGGAPLPPTVKHVGRVSDGQLRALYEHAACFVYPSLYEGFGLPPLEAMACGCPVLVSNTASLPEVCANAALYCDPRSPADIAAKLHELLADNALSAWLRDRGRTRAHQFTWSRCAEQVWQEVLVALGERPASSARLASEPRGDSR